MVQDSPTYTRIRDLCAASETVGPKTPGVALYVFETTSVREPEWGYLHSVLALSEADAVDELLDHYFGARNPAWHSYQLKRIQTWDDAAGVWRSRPARRPLVRNEAAVAA